MFNDGNTRDFQKGLDAEERRRNREDERYRLRKQDRETRLQKRRPLSHSHDNNSSAFTGGGGENGVTMMDPYTENMLAELPNLVQGVYSDNINTQFECAGRIRKLLSIERSPPIQQVIDSGVVPRLVELLKCSSHKKLQFEAAWALTNIASGSAEHTAVVIRNGAVPIFVELLHADAIEVQEQAVWALGNIAGDSPECRNLVLSNGALHKLLPLCNPAEATDEAKVSLLRNATWTLSNFCRGKPQPDYNSIKDALPTLTQLLHINDEEVLQDACWAFSYLSDVDAERGEDVRVQQQIVSAGAMTRLVDLLAHNANNVKHPALRTIGNIVTGDDMQTQRVLNLNCLQQIGGLLDNEKKSIKKEACWTISNITAGNVDQIESIIAANLIPPLVYLLKHDEFDVQKEAAWALSNATSGGSPPQIRYLVEQGSIPPLCNLFGCPSPKIIMVALEGIENILRVGQMDMESYHGINKYAQFVEECDGLNKLDQLQSRDDIPDDIYEKVVHLIKEFWGVEGDENDDGSMRPAIDETGNQFSFGGDDNPPDNNQPYVF